MRGEIGVWGFPLEITGSEKTLGAGGWEHISSRNVRCLSAPAVIHNGTTFSFCRYSMKSSRRRWDVLSSGAPKTAAHPDSLDGGITHAFPCRHNKNAMFNQERIYFGWACCSMPQLLVGRYFMQFLSSSGQRTWSEVARVHIFSPRWHLHMQPGPKTIVFMLFFFFFSPCSLPCLFFFFFFPLSLLLSLSVEVENLK